MLVVTGFALRFPEAWWVEVLSYLGMTEPVRADLHRINAVLLVMVAVSHVLYIILRKRGRDEFRAMVPQVQDVKDAYDAMRFYTWRSDKEVEFGRYDYTQKAEYWALVWGTALMALTGVVLWFPEQAVSIVPPIMVTVSQTIHYYEAWLATLAILVWHFFFVGFHPDAYPMSWTWLTGKMPKQTAAKHHARWYKEQLQAEEQEGDAEQAATAPDDQSRA
jgi:formate dehydrogenase gamma subunit